MATVVSVLSIFVFCALFGRTLIDFVCKILGIIILGGMFGLVGGAFGWLIAGLVFSASTIGFIIGFIVGIIIYICKWL